MPVTYTALTTLMGEAAAQKLGDAVEAVEPAPTGIGVFEVEDGSGLWEVGAYFIDPPDEIALMLLAAAHDAKPFVISEVPETDWVAHVRRELAPVEAGRFFVYGSHDADQVPGDGRIALQIDAAMAFGTGHHGTTQGCLMAFDRLLEQGFSASNVLDLGCGTAVLAMAAAAVTKQPVLATDIDPIAVDVAKVNIAANGMDSLVSCVVSEGFADEEIARHAPYDLIFANILKGPLIDLAPDMAKHIAPGGKLILSGLLREQSAEITGIYEEIGFKMSHKIDLGEWSALTLTI